MVKPGPRRRSGRSEGAAAETRRRLVEGAIHALKDEGFAGASARAIARRAGVNQALVFYHFGTMNELLLAALDETSDRRMHRYREALAGVETLPDLVRVAGQIYREDLDSGHIKVLTEVIAAASSVPDLGPKVVARMEPWIAFTEEAIGRVLDRSTLGALLPRRDIAFGVVALYLGVEILTHLEDDRARSERLFDLLAGATPLLQGLLGSGG